MKNWSGVVLWLCVYAFAVPAYADLNIIPKFKDVTKDIYRGGRPTSKDLADIQKTPGIKTDIDLENIKSQISSESSTAKELKLNFYSEPMTAYNAPDDKQVDRILDLLQNASLFPIFLHCKHGEDRTGMIIGLYRVEVQKWAPKEAYKEMLDLGFHPSYTALDRYFKKRVGL